MNKAEKEQALKLSTLYKELAEKGRNLFSRKCKHPFAKLVVKKDLTINLIDNDFEHITYHLHCTHCDTNLDIKYARLIGGVDAFLNRGN